MSRSHQRKKQPELVRRSLIDCAARIVAEAGVGGATIQAVADAAGVTKGGLLHHFPSKQILIEALFADLLEQLDAQLDAQLEGELEGDARSYGRFTRAYVRAMTRLSEEASTGVWTDLPLAMPIGRAPCRERVCQCVWIPVVPASIKKTTKRKT